MADGVDERPCSSWLNPAPSLRCPPLFHPASPRPRFCVSPSSGHKGRGHTIPNGEPSEMNTAGRCDVTSYSRSMVYRSLVAQHSFFYAAAMRQQSRAPRKNIERNTEERTADATRRTFLAKRNCHTQLDSFTQTSHLQGQMRRVFCQADLIQQYNHHGVGCRFVTAPGCVEGLFQHPPNHVNMVCEIVLFFTSSARTIPGTSSLRYVSTTRARNIPRIRCFRS